jgi:putative addiction module killer protein
MFEILQTPAFSEWLHGLRDLKAKARIISRLESFGGGHSGDAKALGAGIAELRIHVGPGYRVYYAMCSQRLIVLLCGGDKSTQQRDILRARRMLQELMKEGITWFG